MIRKWLSKFLVALANTVDPKNTPPAAENPSFAPPGDTPAHPVAPIYRPIEAAPRVPNVPPDQLARHWRAALDYISFKEFGGNNSPIARHGLEQVRGLGATVDAEGSLPAGSNVHVVLTLYDARKHDKGQHFLLAVPATLVDGTYLYPRTDTPPVINPAYLAPDLAPSAFQLAEAGDANDAMTTALRDMVADETLVPGWLAWWDVSMSVLHQLLGAADDTSMLERLVERMPEKPSRTPPSYALQAMVFSAKGDGTNQIALAYASIQQAIHRKDRRVSLFERLGGGEHAVDIGLMPVEGYRRIVGHIDEYEAVEQADGLRSLFPLDETQRKAVAAILSLEDGEIQAVNGPPGSGKTSMLRAVVASQWVAAALEGSACPITFACGATNQSVTNVIEAFGNAPHHDANMPHGRRWIADATSYGAYMPAASRLRKVEAKAELGRFVCLQSTKGTGFPYAYWNRPDALDPMRAQEYEEAYRTHARKMFGDAATATMDSAIHAVWTRLKDVMGRMAHFTSTWKHDASWRELALARVKSLDHVWSVARVTEALACIAALHAQPTEERAQALADLLWRADVFHWAARYWEGRFLLAQRERLTSRHPLNVEEALRRICMLTPCIVSTLHSAPNLLAIDAQLVDKADPIGHVLGKVDLLVIDEAGQASPELAAAAFALARRAAVVGDMKQLAPIWNHTTLTELGVAAQAGTLDSLDDIVRSRRSVASGSTLGMARLLSRWREPDDIGVTLRFHYRCKPDIISYCNALAYRGQLIARTKEDDKGPEPTMAWVAVDAEPHASGGSWNNAREADEIVSWVVERWPEWRTSEATRGKPLHQIVALITPYRSQANLLEERLANRFDDARKNQGGTWPDATDVQKVVIGTVHRLQGAERPIVCFSLVEGPEQAGGSFVDTDASLLNVAVSRAKRSFIIFANPRRLFPATADEEIATLSPSHQLGAHLRRRINARPLYPRRAVFIEANNKQRTLSAILGKASGVVPTSGALTHLPLGDGVDVMAGFLPRPVNEEKATAFIGSATRLLDEVDDVVLATDDDRMGEYIAWQITRLLGERLAGKRVARVRLGAMTRSAVNAAITRATALDERKVMAEIVREIADCLITEHFRQVKISRETRRIGNDFYERLSSIGATDDMAATEGMPTLGRVQAAILGLLIRQARQALRRTGCTRVLVSIEWKGVTLHGEQIDLSTGETAWAPEEHAGSPPQIVLRPDGPPVRLEENVDPPQAGTLSIMAQAWRRFRLAPWDTMAALQALYDGTWAKPEYAAMVADAFEPAEPIVPEERDGHPPITPLDRMSPPEVLDHVFVSPSCENVYGLVWERFKATEQGPYRVRFVTLDIPLCEPAEPSIRIRLRACDCEPANRTSNDRDGEVRRLLLGDEAADANDVDTLLDAWNAGAFDDAIPRISTKAASPWDMPLDRLLLDLESQGIGRPSTLAESLRKLVEKGLIVLPEGQGSIKLTRAGVTAGLALETQWPEVSSPDFSGWLGQRLQAIEQGSAGPRDVLQWFARFFMPALDAHRLAPRIWNSLAELEQAMDRMRTTRFSGGLVAPAADRAAPSDKASDE